MHHHRWQILEAQIKYVVRASAKQNEPIEYLRSKLINKRPYSQIANQPGFDSNRQDIVIHSLVLVQNFAYPTHDEIGRKHQP